ncbi:MAG: ankyrin repeat domain-containing protein [Pseudomonadota bacterium]
MNHKKYGYALRSRIACLSYICLLIGLLNACASTTPLLIASSQGDINTMDALVKSGADIHEQEDCDGTDYLTTTPLVCAIWHGQVEAVKFLLDKGSDIDYKPLDSPPPLVVATLRHKTDIVKLLLDRGANPNNCGWGGYCPLYSAAYFGYFDIVKLLIDRGADIDNAIQDLEELGRNPGSSSQAQIETAISHLHKLKPKEEVVVNNIVPSISSASASGSSTLTKDDIASIVKATVEGVAKSQKKEVNSESIKTDIDKPEFSAADKIMGDNDLAVIIGIEGYSSLPKSDYSYDDARLVKEYVKALGFRERNVEFITDEKATLSGIAKTIEIWLKNKAKEDSRVFVYYSGHGAPDPATGEAYLVPYDGDPNYLSVTGYSLKKLYSILGQLQVQEVVVILDSCFSGSGGRSVLAQGARPLVMVVETASLSSNIAVLTATQGNQISTSSQEKGHGIFTYYFLKAIKEGNRNLNEIYAYIKPFVEDEAKQLNVQQSPSLNPSPEKLTGRFNLRK